MVGAEGRAGAEGEPSGVSADYDDDVIDAALERELSDELEAERVELERIEAQVCRACGFAGGVHDDDCPKVAA